MEQADIQKVREELAGLREQFARVVVGQEELFETALIALLTGGHLLIQGVPGLAKTLAVKTFADCIRGSFARIQFTPDLLPADITGCRIYQPELKSFAVDRGPVFANIVLADEINRAPARTQSALLEVMQERQVTIAGESIPLQEPFLVAATCNPIEQRGTYPLPEAQKDRFLMQVDLAYPDRQEELRILERMGGGSVPAIQRRTNLRTLLEARKAVAAVHVDGRIHQYVLDLVVATRPGNERNLSARQEGVSLRDLHRRIALGASPRASLALLTTAKATAFLEGRDYVLPGDVRRRAPAVLRHRLQLDFLEGDFAGDPMDEVIRQLLQTVRMP